MADLTPETLAAWRAHWTDLKERGGQDVIITPEFALALLDEITKTKDERNYWKICAEKAEVALSLALNQQVEAERKYADLVAAVRGLAERKAALAAQCEGVVTEHTAHDPEGAEDNPTVYENQRDAEELRADEAALRALIGADQ